MHHTADLRVSAVLSTCRELEGDSHLAIYTGTKCHGRSRDPGKNVRPRAIQNCPRTNPYQGPHPRSLSSITFFNHEMPSHGIMLDDAAPYSCEEKFTRYLQAIDGITVTQSEMLFKMSYCATYGRCKLKIVLSSSGFFS